LIPRHFRKIPAPRNNLPVTVNLTNRQGNQLTRALGIFVGARHVSHLLNGFLDAFRGIRRSRHRGSCAADRSAPSPFFRQVKSGSDADVARQADTIRPLIAVSNPEMATGRRNAPEADLSEVLIAHTAPERLAGRPRAH
jgi:hypothetical protein